MKGVEWWLVGGVVGATLLAMMYFRYRHPRPDLMVKDSDVDAVPEETIGLPADGSISLFDDAPVGLCQLDRRGRILRTNTFFQSLLGLTADTLHDTSFLALVHAEDLDRARLDQRELLSRHSSYCESEIRLRDVRGQVLWTRLSLRLVRNHRGRAHYFIASFIDIGTQKRSDALHYLLEEKLRTIVGHMSVAVWLSAPEDARILFVNDAFETIWGYGRESFYADPDSALRRIHPEDRESVRQAIAVAGTQGSYDINYRILRDDGGIRYVRDMGRGIFDSHGRMQYRVSSVTDISSEMLLRDELCATNSQLRESNQRWQESARLDSLTRCLNRSAFFEEAEKALQLEQRYRRSSTLVFFDLNKFKDVNDNFGHHVGDRALIAFVGQIKTRLRTTDELGRYGGDEFVALLRETDALQAQLLLATLAPIVVDAENGNSVILRFSAGVACSDDPAIETVDDWMRIADSQMYYQRTRRSGR